MTDTPINATVQDVANPAPTSETSSQDAKKSETMNSDSTIIAKLAKDLGVSTTQVSAFAELYDDGATVPFIARYRKDKTGGLDDAQLRTLEKSLNYERDMASRRAKILELLTNQGNLTDELKTRIANASSKLELEDIYLPYRPRRRSLSAKAKLAGLEPMAMALLQTEVTPTEALAGYQAPENLTDDAGNEVDADFSSLDKQLAGVESIIIDKWTESLDLLDELRTGFGKTAVIVSQVASDEKREVGEKFKDYFDPTENLARLPNHRLLAMLRGRQENVLTLKVDGEDEPFLQRIQQYFELNNKSPEARQAFLQDASTKLWQDKWRPHIEHRLLTEKRLTAEADAIDVFAGNLSHLLMSAPAGRKVILGVDPGIRHGVKMAVIDTQGHVIQNEASKESGEFAVATVYPFAPDNKMDEAKAVITDLIKTHGVELIAIGNGTASRETDAMIKAVIDADDAINAVPVMVNESGASVYSASELASDELGELDVSLRGAVSIARRLQDPLSELVKVEPKAIGVGQYQHDVNQNELSDRLDKVTQDCVNAVGVDVNTASPAILTHIAGLNRNVAQQIVTYRREHGAFQSREQLKDVPRLGAKTFEQSAGFLRIKDGQEPLDATGVHPESYAQLKQLLANANLSLSDVLGNAEALNLLSIGDDKTASQESTTKQDTPQNETAISLASIKQELLKPAHDPRPEFKTAQFAEGVNEVSDLEQGMVLEGVVTNVTAFGCFVDVGVHQDGLVHISEMADKFVEDPMNIVKPGDIVTVRVLSVDEARGRIGFSMKSEQAGEASQGSSNKQNSRSANNANTNPPKHDRKSSPKKQHSNDRRSSNRPSNKSAQGLNTLRSTYPSNSYSNTSCQ